MFLTQLNSLEQSANIHNEYWYDLDDFEVLISDGVEI